MKTRSEMGKQFYTLATVAFALISLHAQAQKVKTTISFGQPTAGVAVDPTLNRIYVVAPSFGGPSDSLAVIDGHTNQVLKTIAVPPGAYLPAVNYLTGKIYVATCNSDADPVVCSVTVVDSAKNKVVKTIPITATDGDGLLGIAVNLTTNNIYVANTSDLVVDVIDGRTDTITKTLPISGGEPEGLAINSFLNILYVPLGNSSVDVFDTKKDVLINTASAGSAESFAAVNLYTGHVFVTDSVAGPSTAQVLDKSGAPLASAAVGDTPYGVDVDPITNLVFVASTALNNVTVINGKTNRVVATIPNIQATFVAVNVVTQDVYVSGQTGVTVLTEK